MSKSVRSESYWTRKLVQYLREERRDLLYIKFADHFTHGIPDQVVVGLNKVLWLELKVLQPKQTMLERAMLDELQLYTMQKIERLTGHALYLMFYPGLTLSYRAVKPSGLLRPEGPVDSTYHENFGSFIGDQFPERE